jgi:hypothetical protein
MTYTVTATNSLADGPCDQSSPAAFSACVSGAERVSGRKVRALGNRDGRAVVGVAGGPSFRPQPDQRADFRATNESIDFG